MCRNCRKEPRLHGAGEPKDGAHWMAFSHCADHPMTEQRSEASGTTPFWKPQSHSSPDTICFCQGPPTAVLLEERFYPMGQLTDALISARKPPMPSGEKRAWWAPATLQKRRLTLVLLGTLLLASASVFALPAEVIVPIVKEHGKADPPAAGVFSHLQHDQYLCFTCHPTLFPRARMGFTHDQMDEGKFCGACHDGQTAPPTSGARATCRSSCHAK